MLFLQVVVLPGSLPLSFSLNLLSSETSKILVSEEEGTIGAALEKKCLPLTFSAGSCSRDTQV